jgi:DNA-nicking Smr family endonuclease
VKKPVGKGGRRHLNDDEAADWDYTVKTIEPLKRAKSRVRAGHEQTTDDAPARRAEETIQAASSRTQTPPGTAGKSKPSALPPKKPVPPISEFDRNNAKKLRSGRVEIEARLDLHGMRQDEAHRALRTFLMRSQRRGLRWVLVITGKGGTGGRSSVEDDDVIPVRDRGVLKRNVPRWLAEPDLRSLVVSFTEAAAPHGGEGALYVHLRKNA